VNKALERLVDVIERAAIGLRCGCGRLSEQLAKIFFSEGELGDK
jgi:hypothetical protein